MELMDPSGVAPEVQEAALIGPETSTSGSGEEPRGGDRATRTAAVIVPDWPLLAALDRLEREQIRQEELRKRREEGEGRPGQPDIGRSSVGGPHIGRPSAHTGQPGTRRSDLGRADADGGAGPASTSAPDVTGGRPVILLERFRVVHAGPAALEAGVAIGMRRRSAQAACPDALILEVDRDNESSLFELVAAAVDTTAAGVDILRPGVLLMSAKGPARHAGGEARLAERIIDAVADLTGWDCSVGIADGPFAALLAARAGRIVTPGRSADYLAPHPVAALRHAPVGPGWGHRDQAAPAAREKRLDLAETVGLLERLGIASLGDLAGLPSASVIDRFGPDVALLQLLSQGREASPPAAHHPERPLHVEKVLETPLERVDQAAFVARPLAEELHTLLVERGLICTRLRIVARTEGGDEMERTWRHEGALTVADVVDRIRWQCDGWITRARLGGPGTGAIVRLSLHPIQLMPAGEGAPALWGTAGEAAQRAARAFARAQGLAGEEAVLVPAPTGGRLLSQEVSLIPWRTEKPIHRKGPWPGSLPTPVPATVFSEPPPIELLDSEGQPVLVTARGLLASPPATLRIPADGGAVLARASGLPAARDLPVSSHSAPVVIDQQWWGSAPQRGARLQVVVNADVALVLLSREGAWMVEGLYD